MVTAGAEEPERSDLRIPTHLEFISQWFPKEANSAMHASISRSARLATLVQTTPSIFGSVHRTVSLIRDHIGFDYSQIEQYTAATITTGVPGTVIFFSLNDPISLQQHFSTGQFPLTPEVHRFHNREVYHLPSADRPLGLYSAEGKHFVLGDWRAFKNTLLGNSGRLNELAKILSAHRAPLIVCSNPRRSGTRHSRDDPFGTVISIDFQDEMLAFLMQEEHPTPAVARKRLTQIEKEMPAAFEAAYGIVTKQGVRYLSESDGRHVSFAAQAPVDVTRKLLNHLLGDAVVLDPRAKASKFAAHSIELFTTAKSAGAAVATLRSPEAIVDALCIGIEDKGGKRYALPFLTGVEQEQIAERLLFDSGALALAPEVEEEVSGPTADEKQIRRHARTIAALTMSAAAAESPQLGKLKTPLEIVDAICATGFNGGSSYESELFKGPELNSAERERVANYLHPQYGYLVYKAD